MADQLQRAALSIVLNIAEGAGKFSSKDKAAFYLRARGSSTESAAVLDVCARLKLVNAGTGEEHKAVLERIAQMLTKLVKVHQERPGSGSGAAATRQCWSERNGGDDDFMKLGLPSCGCKTRPAQS